MSPFSPLLGLAGALPADNIFSQGEPLIGVPPLISFDVYLQTTAAYTVRIAKVKPATVQIFNGVVS